MSCVRRRPWAVALLVAAVATVSAWPAVAATTPAAAVRFDHCSWDRPGHNAFVGDVVAAVDRYADIPAAVRQRLQQRMQRRQYDDIVEIRRDRIEGRARYASEITEMHFGRGDVCARATRERWSDDMVERGLVYCDSGHCVMVPTVCRNVSRITALAPAPTPVAVAAPGAAGEDAPLAFDAPAAGRRDGAATDAFELPAAGGSPLGGVPAMDEQIAAASPAGRSFDEASRPGPIWQPVGGGGGGGGWVPAPPDVVPAPVPEPATWLLWLAGAGATVAAARRRRR